ncbi:hypothetical protein PMPD1_2485 [Paramixta manurensis]|uniref:MmcB family DNA repair protein n=1 Tax=Paramixta manurensis TaxID=2740817 RepID=A0A6M8UG86_9GAMM|nr:hypothetical protein PMPD1_2485 [Erwiniaceae bacterium PD-1]
MSMFTMQKWQHDALAHDLAEHLRRNTSRFVWEDMQLGPSGSARPDVYAVPFSFSKFCPVAYECKISVSDFRADVTKGKYTRYLSYASGVVFAVPEGLIKKSELPAGCGLMVRGGNGWRNVKGPTMQAVDNLPRDAWIKLLIDGIARENKRTELKIRQACVWFTERELAKRHGDEIATLVARAYTATDNLADEIARCDEQREAIRNQTHHELQYSREAVARAVERLNHAQKELALSLGLPEESTIRQLTLAIQDASRRLQGDAEVMRLRQLFSSVKRAINSASEPLPGEGV